VKESIKLVNKNTSPTAAQTNPSYWRKCLQASLRTTGEQENSDELHVGSRLKTLRTAQGLSIRALADICGLNFNTLSLIENEKTSPNVNTLQQIASALQVPVTEFFEPVQERQDVLFQRSGQHPSASFACGELADLGGGLALGEATPLLLTAHPGTASSADPIVHTGQEFIYCLVGSLTYHVGEEEYTLETGDSLIFAAHIPHRWENRGTQDCRCLLIICPADYSDRSVEQHLLAKE
jgi:transcriptional regulator with XRE-family HTH domain